MESIISQFSNMRAPTYKNIKQVLCSVNKSSNKNIEICNICWNNKLSEFSLFMCPTASGNGTQEIGQS